MTGETAWLLWMAGGTLLGAAVTAVVLLALPGPARVPRERRRPDGLAQGALSRAADLATGSVQGLIGERPGAGGELLERAGVKQPLQNLIVLTISAMIAAGALGVLLGGVLLGLVLVVAVPVVVWLGLRMMVSRRESAFADQLDETLQIIAGSLRAGYSLPQSLATVALETEVPTSVEFSRIVNETRVGRDLDLSLTDTARRTRNADFFWVAQAISINREVGGNLAEVLEGVGSTIRQRAALRRQVKALAAEGKLSAFVLGALPFVLFAAMWILNRAYVTLLFTTLPGVVMLVAAIVLLAVGLLWLSRMIKIRY